MQFKSLTKSLLFLTIPAFILTGCLEAKQETDSAVGGSRINNTVPPRPDQVELTLDWAIPAENPVVTSGYYVYYGRNSGSLNKKIDVGMTSSVTLSGTDFEFNDLGTYYFHVTAYNADKSMFSLPSPEAAVNITL